MRKRTAFIALLVFLVSLFACTAGKDEFEQAGSKFVEQLAEERFEDAANTFDETMAGLISPEKLKELWDQLFEKSGTFQKQLSTRRETYLQYEIVFVTCQFENGKLDVKVVYDKSKRVAGLFFVPASIQ
ncbi:MAG: DUF3887 domain-containing protein [bacterium]|nr:DUF3887 domain-containing protein [bacterium]